jgi:ring-1,2-phenylacetyl-CoA epoxidase subunit PaaC
MVSSLDAATQAHLVAYLLRLGDDRLVLGHRLSEWCGHAPILEEDIALANIALDLIGQSALLLTLAGEAEGASRDQDALAYFREAVDFRNALLVELPKGDFAFTIVRQFLFSAFALRQWEALTRSKHEELAGIAAKALKETKYQLRHTADWMLKLGDGTDESHRRAQSALDDLWPYTEELFFSDDAEHTLAQRGIAVDPATLQEGWSNDVSAVIERATLTVPEAPWMQQGGRVGRHTEHLGHMLAEMQIVARSFPGASW